LGEVLEAKDDSIEDERVDSLATIDTVLGFHELVNNYLQ
jgi:hypothetical protein